MPYLRLSSLPLDEATKRHLADELTATVLDVLTGEKPEWTSVHFTPFEPSDFAIAGRLVVDGGIVDTHLEISAPGVDEKSWHALRNRLTDVLVEALAIPDSERWHVNVKLNQYDPHSFALAGNPADELDDDGGLEQPSRRKSGALSPVLLIGFVLGAIGAYQWLTARINSDATVDVAAPNPPSAPPSAGSPAADAARGDKAEFSHQADEGASPPAEY